MFGVRLSKMGSASKLGLIAKAIGILRSYGADAHVYLPGIGTVNGLTAGNYLDSAGTTAASVDNPVGLSLDALQAMTLGSELAGLSSAWLTYGTGISLSGGQMIFSSTPAVQYTLKSVSAISAKKTYKLTLTIDSISGGDLSFVVSGGAGITPKSAPGTYTAMAVSDGIDGPYMFALNGTVNAVVSVASCVEIPGIHATQATTANKPILRRGLLNQLLWSQDPGNAAWTKTNAGTGAVPVITGGFTDPFGGTNASRLQLNCGGGTTSSDISYLAQGITTVNSPMTAVYYLKTNDGITKNVTLRAGAAVFQQTAITPDWTVYAVPSSTSNDRIAILLYGNNGVQTADLLIYRAGLFQGTYTAQQIIDAGGIPLTTSAAASNPSAGKYSWQFDGSNDSLSLSAPLFQMSDDHAVIAGFNAAVINKYVFSQNNTAASTLVASLRIDAAGAPNALWQDDTAALVNIASSTSCIGANTVATAVKIGNAKRLRVNGVQQGATNNTVLGATTLNNYAIGSYTTGGYFQGSIYPIIAINGTLSDSDLLVLERFVGQMAGVSI